MEKSSGEACRHTNNGRSHMHLNAFINKPRKPSDAELSIALGPTKALWDKIIDVAREMGAVDHEWKSFSEKYGWSLRLKQKKRNILYLSPATGSFLASLILGDRAMAASRQSGLTKKMMKVLAEANRYPEGTAIRIDVRKKADLGTITKLIAIKLE